MSSSLNRWWSSFAVTLIKLAISVSIGSPLPSAHAQPPAARGPTTVQLPTFQQFSIQTSVSVPDRGTMVLGGVDRAASGVNTRGVPGFSHIPGANRLFKNRAIGRDVGSSQASVSVWVHDLKGMDEAILAEAAARRDATQTPASVLPSQTVASLPSAASTTADRNHAPLSLRSIQAAQRAEDRQRDLEARELLAQGDQAEAEGKPGVARLFYQMAARRSPATMTTAVQTRLQQLVAGSAH